MVGFGRQPGGSGWNGGGRKKSHESAICCPARDAGGLGHWAGGVQALHAQAKPQVYYITEIEVRDPVGFAKDYLLVMQPIIKADGGRFVALGGPAGGGDVTAIEGAPPASRVAVLVRDSLEKVQAHRQSAAFKEARKIGEKYATFRSFTVDALLN